MSKPFHEFPKWKYHPEHQAKIVHDESEEAELGHGWGDSPDHGKKKDNEKKPEPVKLEPAEYAKLDDEPEKQEPKKLDRRGKA